MYHDWKYYDVWFPRNGVRWTERFVILGHMLPFYPPHDQENQNFKKMNKTPEVLSFYTCHVSINIFKCNSNS